MDAKDIPSTSGIYKITCIGTGRIYVGSAINLRKRLREHRHHLIHRKHANNRLQRAFNKHGDLSFVFSVIELVPDPEQLIKREQYWFDTLKPFDDNGYNIDRIAASRLGSTVSPETREKLRLANLGKKHSPESIQARAEAGRGRRHTAESKEKLSNALLNHPVSKESREKMKLAQLGKKQSEAVIEKRRQSSLGRKPSQVTCQKISESNIASNRWRMKTLIVTAPDGSIHVAHGIGQFAKEHNLNRSALAQVAMGNAPHHKGWKARYATEKDLRPAE